MAKPIYNQDAEEAYLLVQKMITSYHSELQDASIKVLYNDADWEKDGMPVFGEIKKMNPLMKEISGFDFVFIINHKFYGSLDLKIREASIDHLLCGWTADYDKEGNPKFIKNNPNVVEFSEMIHRYGAYSIGLQEAKIAFMEKEKKEKGSEKS